MAADHFTWRLILLMLYWLLGGREERDPQHVHERPDREGQQQQQQLGVFGELLPDVCQVL